MRTEFNSFLQQMQYINHFIHRNTSIKLNCQICGNPGDIRHNKENPYKIQILCQSCRNMLDIGREGMCSSLPTIDILKCITNKNNTHYKLMKARKNLISNIDKILEEHMSQQEALEFLGVTRHMYDLLIKEYEKETGKDIKAKLRKNYNTIKAINIKNRSLSKVDEYNNISKIKRQLNLSNKDIAKLSNYTINTTALSNISNGKQQPNLRTKLILSDIFNKSIQEIFPEDSKYITIKSSSHYNTLCNNVRDSLRLYYKMQRGKNKYSHAVKDMSIILNVRADIIYRILEHDSEISLKNLTTILCNMPNLLS